jgi:hypothetical protein
MQHDDDIRARKGESLRRAELAVERLAAGGMILVVDDFDRRTRRTF